MDDFTIQPLSMQTWPDFAALVERHGGVWGGCWCMEFHVDGKARGPHRRAAKECHVREGTAHAALVYDGARCIGWCQFGPPAELPRIKHLRVYTQGLQRLPDWRITCLFVDKDYRGRGVSERAVAGALALIAQRGGGVVESYPEQCEGRRTSAGFLHNGGLSVFERQGFTRDRPIGLHHWVVSRVVAPAA